jgi:hypothetical protein
VNLTAEDKKRLDQFLPPTRSGQTTRPPDECHDILVIAAEWSDHLTTRRVP